MAEYNSYLLRVWRSRRAGGWEWALRLEHLRDGAVQRFDDPAALVDALWELAEAEAPGSLHAGRQEGDGQSDHPGDKEQH
jgi:hypothetical protein